MRWINETIELPRADLSTRIAEMQQLRDRLVQSLQGTTLNLKTFLPLIVKYRVFDQFPSYYSHRYQHEENLGRTDLVTMDARNRADINLYVQNIEIMERLTRINTNLALLQRHQEQNLEAPSRTVDVELIGFRLGDFVLTTFPGELTVQIGLNLKQQSPHPFTFVAGYTNGYIYYSPTAEQLANAEGAQEDTDCILAPHWQELYESKAMELLNRL
jgi:hypothetical protein